MFQKSSIKCENSFYPITKVTRESLNVCHLNKKSIYHQICFKTLKDLQLIEKFSSSYHILKEKYSTAKENEKIVTHD